jgi:hypothetical protein
VIRAYLESIAKSVYEVSRIVEESSFSPRDAYRDVGGRTESGTEVEKDRPLQGILPTAAFAHPCSSDEGKEKTSYVFKSLAPSP